MLIRYSWHHPKASSVFPKQNKELDEKQCVISLNVADTQLVLNLYALLDLL